MSGEWIQAPKRNIVKYGIYKFTQDMRRSAGIRVYSTVERQPTNKFLNFKRTKPRTHLGYAQILYGDVVLNEVEIAFDTQLIFTWDSEVNKLIVFQGCLIYSLQQYISQSATGGFPEPLPPNVRYMESCAADRIAFKLYGNATLTVTLEYAPLVNYCGLAGYDWFDDELIPPVTTPLPAAPNPADESGNYDVPTAPYDPVTSDNGESYSPPVPPPPPPQPNVFYAVVVNISGQGDSGYNYPFTWTATVRGGINAPVVEARITSPATGSTQQSVYFTTVRDGIPTRLSVSSSNPNVPATMTLVGWSQTPI